MSERAIEADAWLVVGEHVKAVFDHRVDAEMFAKTWWPTADIFPCRTFAAIEAMEQQHTELLDALLYVQKQVESGQEIAMSQVNAAIRNAKGKS